MPPALTFGLDVGIYGRLATRDEILALATLADTSGFAAVWVADHVIFPATFTSRYPYNASGTFPLDMSQERLLEPLATMGVLVGATQRVKIGAAVLVMPYRNPVLLGRMLATLDVLSGGRMILGAGVGWLEEEFVALDARPFAARGQVTDEAIQIVQRLCQGGEVAFQGEHYRFETLVSNPGSVQRPHPPILIGGTSAAALRRVARLGNGWLSTGLRPERLTAPLQKLRALWAEHGRRPEDLQLYHKLFINLEAAQYGADGVREAGTGTPAQVLDDLRRLIDLGYHSVIVRYRGNDAATQRQQITRWLSEVMPHV